MTSLREIGGAADTHIILCGDKKSHMKIKKNISTERILKISVYGIVIQMAYAFFKGHANTQNI